MTVIVVKYLTGKFQFMTYESPFIMKYMEHVKLEGVEANQLKKELDNYPKNEQEILKGYFNRKTNRNYLYS